MNQSLNRQELGSQDIPNNQSNYCWDRNQLCGEAMLVFSPAVVCALILEDNRLLKLIQQQKKSDIPTIWDTATWSKLWSFVSLDFCWVEAAKTNLDSYKMPTNTKLIYSHYNLIHFSSKLDVQADWKHHIYFIVNTVHPEGPLLCWVLGISVDIIGLHNVKGILLASDAGDTLFLLELNSFYYSWPCYPYLSFKVYRQYRKNWCGLRIILLTGVYVTTSDAVAPSANLLWSSPRFCSRSILFSTYMIPKGMHFRKFLLIQTIQESSNTWAKVLLSQCSL